MSGKLMGAAIYPHPPIIIHEIGKGKEQMARDTIAGVIAVSRRIATLKPELVIVISPHGTMYRDAVSIQIDRRLKGNFGQFGYEDVSYAWDNHLPFVDKILRKCQTERINLIPLVEKRGAENQDIFDESNHSLDHGVLVPLYFLDKEWSHFRIVSLTYGLLPPRDLAALGKFLRETVEEMDIPSVIIASGDLSHCLSNNGPYEYGEMGKVFDEKIVNLVKGGKMEEIISFDYELSSRAKECGLRSFQIMAGALEGLELDSRVYSYEGPFGVGYMTAFLENLGQKVNVSRAGEDIYVKLARESLEYYVFHGESMATPENLPSELKKQKLPCFVSIKKDGELRGCIGTLSSSHENLAREIIENAIAAGMHDPRFHQIKREELTDLTYSVDVLGRPEQVKSLDELDPKKYGILVSLGRRKGILLPDLEGIHRIEDQIEIALGKAGIDKDEKYILERFEVERHH